MRKLLRQLAEEAKVGRYVLTVSGGAVRGEDPDTGRMDKLGQGEADYRTLSRLATERARNEFDEDDNLLAGYLYGKDLSKERIHRIDSPNIAIGNDGKVTTTFQVTAAPDLSEKEKDALGEYVLGQCSDGWGEGFEQFEFTVGGDRLYVSTWSTRATAKVTAR